MHRSPLSLALTLAALLAVALATAPCAAALPAAHPRAAIVAQDCLDYPYAAGGQSLDGFDAPGLASYCYAQLGLALPHRTSGIIEQSTRITRTQAKPGDILVFEQGSGVARVAVYTGDDAMVYASATQGYVVYDLVPWRHLASVRRYGTTVSTPAPWPQAVAIAQRYLGVPYVWGGSSPSGFDSSGLTMYVYAQLGVGLAHEATAQLRACVRIPLGSLQPGDLVFFGNDSYCYHVGIYVGGDSMVHATHAGDIVRYGSIKGAFIGGRPRH